jgi:YD repeat-containing protein
VTDPNGAKTTYCYDTFGRLKDVRRPGNGEATACGTAPSGGSTVEYAYDFDFTPQQGNGVRNRVITKERDDRAGTDGLRYSVQFFDGLGRPIEAKQELTDQSGGSSAFSVSPTPSPRTTAPVASRRSRGRTPPLRPSPTPTAPAR